jgi:peptidoglycan hydrolase CwlO-like protein
MNVNIGTIITALSLLIAGISLLRVFSRDGKGATKDFTRVETKIDYIGGDIKDIRDDVKAVSVRQEDMAERLVKVEESTKSAHHRIDGIEEQIK